MTNKFNIPKLQLPGSAYDTKTLPASRRPLLHINTSFGIHVNINTNLQGLLSPRTESRQKFWQSVREEFSSHKKERTISFDDYNSVELLALGAQWIDLVPSEYIDIFGALYDESKALAIDPMVQSRIVKDIHRTFGVFDRNSCLGIQFHSDPEAYCTSLENILLASSYESGYCQGINFIAALFLLTESSEKSAFTLLCFVLKHRNLDILFDSRCSSLVEYMKMFDKKLRVHNKRVYKHLKSCGLTNVFYALEWFTTCFVVSCPENFCTYVMDLLLCDVSDAFIRVGLAIMDALESCILTSNSDNIHENFKATCLTLDPKVIIPKALVIHIEKKQRVLQTMRSNIDRMCPTEEFIDTLRTPSYDNTGWNEDDSTENDTIEHSYVSFNQRYNSFTNSRRSSFSFQNDSNNSSLDEYYDFRCHRLEKIQPTSTNNCKKSSLFEMKHAMDDLSLELQESCLINITNKSTKRMSSTILSPKSILDVLNISQTPKSKDIAIRHPSKNSKNSNSSKVISNLDKHGLFALNEIDGNSRLRSRYLKPIYQLASVDQNTIDKLLLFSKSYELLSSKFDENLLSLVSNIRDCDRYKASSLPYHPSYPRNVFSELFNSFRLGLQSSSTSSTLATVSSSHNNQNNFVSIAYNDNNLNCNSYKYDSNHIKIINPIFMSIDFYTRFHIARNKYFKSCNRIRKRSKRYRSIALLRRKILVSNDCNTSSESPSPSLSSRSKGTVKSPPLFQEIMIKRPYSTLTDDKQTNRVTIMRPSSSNSIISVSSGIKSFSLFLSTFSFPSKSTQDYPTSLGDLSFPRDMHMDIEDSNSCNAEGELSYFSASDDDDGGDDDDDPFLESIVIYNARAIKEYNFIDIHRLEFFQKPFIESLYYPRCTGLKNGSHQYNSSSTINSIDENDISRVTSPSLSIANTSRRFSQDDSWAISYLHDERISPSISTSIDQLEDGRIINHCVSLKKLNIKHHNKTDSHNTKKIRNTGKLISVYRSDGSAFRTISHNAKALDLNQIKDTNNIDKQSKFPCHEIENNFPEETRKIKIKRVTRLKR